MVKWYFDAEIFVQDSCHKVKNCVSGLVLKKLGTNGHISYMIKRIRSRAQYAVSEATMSTWADTIFCPT